MSNLRNIDGDGLQASSQTRSTNRLSDYKNVEEDERAKKAWFYQKIMFATITCIALFSILFSVFEKNKSDPPEPIQPGGTIDDVKNMLLSAPNGSDASMKLW